MNEEPLREALEGIRLEFERNRAFNREMLVRYDQLARDSERRWVDESRRSREVMSALVHQINELRRETRAQTEAIFRVIDRLDRGGGSAPATS